MNYPGVDGNTVISLLATIAKSDSITINPHAGSLRGRMWERQVLKYLDTLKKPHVFSIPPSPNGSILVLASVLCFKHQHSQYFYRVLITEALLTAVETASFPSEETVVLKFIPSVPDLDLYVSDGMRIASQCMNTSCFTSGDFHAKLICKQSSPGST